MQQCICIFILEIFIARVSNKICWKYFVGDPSQVWENKSQNHFNHIQELFVDKFSKYSAAFFKYCTRRNFSLRNYWVIWPQPIPQGICLAHVYLKTLGVIFSKNNLCPAIFWKMSPPKENISEQWRICWGTSPKNSHQTTPQQIPEVFLIRVYLPKLFKHYFQHFWTLHLIPANVAGFVVIFVCSISSKSLLEFSWNISDKIFWK